MSNERMIEAVKRQGETLVKRAEWLQQAIDQRQRANLVAEQMTEQYLVELKATWAMVEAARAEYLRLVKESQ